MGADDCHGRWRFSRRAYIHFYLRRGDRPASSQIHRQPRSPPACPTLKRTYSPLPRPRIMNRDYRVSTRRNLCVGNATSGASEATGYKYEEKVTSEDKEFPLLRHEVVAPPRKRLEGAAGEQPGISFSSVGE